jgi:hypothetical protein
MEHREAFNERDCLNADPFAGDFGSPGDRTLRKQMVTSRKTHECSLCLGEIQKGERTRVQIELFDGELQDYRWCFKCCRAFAQSDTDAGRMWESRERLRGIRAQAQVA